MFHSEKSLWPCDHDNPWAQAHLGANCVGGNCLRQRVSTSEEKLVDLKDLKECWKVSAPETLEILLPAHPAFLALKESLFPLLPAKDSNARVFSSHLINIAGHSWATTWKPNQHMGLIKNSVPQIWWFIIILAFFMRAHLCMIYTINIYVPHFWTNHDKPISENHVTMHFDTFWWCKMWKSWDRGWQLMEFAAHVTWTNPFSAATTSSQAAAGNSVKKHFFCWIDLWLMGIPLID